MKLRINKKLFLSNEIIEYQDSSFGIMLEECIDPIRKEILDHGRVRKELVSELSKCIEIRLGLKNIIYTKESLAACIPLYLNQQHIFLSDFFKGDVSKYIRKQKEFIKGIKDFKGTVDLKNAKLGGVFSEYEHDIYLNFKYLFGMLRLSTKEVVAVLLHELGHCFNTCELSDRLMSMNRSLLNVADEIGSKKKEANRVYIYKELKSINENIKEEDIEDIVEGKSTIMGVKMYRKLVDIYSNSKISQMEIYKYDDTSNEMLADNFATRFGYGKELVIALDKITTMFTEGANHRGTFVSVIMSILNLFIMTAMCIITLFVAGGVFAPLGVLMMLIGIITFLLAGDRNRDLTYDDLKDRYKRVRNGLVTNLKELKELNKDKIKSILNSISSIDDVMDVTSGYKGLFTNIANTILPWNWSTNNSIKEQQLAEQLANNELFVKASQFKIK